MSCAVGGGSCSRSSSVRPPAFAPLLLAALMFAVENRAVLTLKLPPLPTTPRWFYNGTYASSFCDTTFRCDTSTRSETVPACSCHANCALFDSCCEDVRPSDWHARALPRDAYECAVHPEMGTDASSTSNVVSAAGFVFLITKCPSTYSMPQIAKLCNVLRSDRSKNDSKHVWWVSDNTTGVTYSNHYCALCNGVRKDRMVFWNFFYSCIEDYAVRPFGLGGCDYYPVKPHHLKDRIPKCLGHYRADCQNGSSLQAQEACTNNSARYLYDITNFVTYRNYNCSLCSASAPIGQTSCTAYYIAFAFPFTADLQGVLGVDVCPEKLSTFATQEDQEQFSTLCPETAIDSENCSATVNVTMLLDLYGGDGGTLEYRIMPNGVRLLYNLSYTMCYRCQPASLINYTFQSGSEIQLSNNNTYPKPLFQVEVNGSVTACLEPKPLELTVLASNDCNGLPSEVSIVLMSLSLLGLAMYMVAYAVLPSLRNLPGQMVLHQSAAFFAAFLLWLLRVPARNSPWACAVLGVLTHFFFLAAFTWTTLYAVEVVRALGFQAYGAGYTKRRLRYTLAGWLVPSIIMVAATSANWSPYDIEPRFRPAYGAPQCFINNPLPQRIFFTAPLAALLLIDVVIYAYVIVQLVVISGQTKAVRENHHEKVALAVKLIFALGITWIFAVIATATENCYVGYIFTLLNSLQGVFLFLIFICNAKTSGQIHQKVRDKKSLSITTGATVSSRDSSSSTAGILAKRKSVLGVKSFSPVSLAMDAHEHASKPPPR